MEHWLVCFPTALAADRRSAILSEAGAHPSPDGEPVPLGDEVAVQVEADAGAVASLRGYDEVRGVYPDSEMSLY